MPLNTNPAYFRFTSFCIYTLMVVCSSCYSQPVTDSLLHQIEKRFKNDYTLQTTMAFVHSRSDTLPDDHVMDCMSGKEMLVFAAFNFEPENLFARMLVTKYFGKKIAYDEHAFQPVKYDYVLGIYYALLQVAFPPEANQNNCSVNLQVFDKKNPKSKVWLLVFAKNT